jgi:hypothetical protein
LRRLSLALALAALAAAPAASQERQEVLRPCRRADLLGYWQVIRFGFASGAAVDRSDPDYRLHQRYVFHPDATMTYAALAAAPTADEERALLEAPADTTWAVDGQGRLLRQRAGGPRTEISECRVVLQALRDPRSPVLARPGDLVLTDQGVDAQPTARRLLRKLSSGE